MAREKQPLCPECGHEMKPSFRECWCPRCEAAKAVRKRAENREAGKVSGGFIRMHKGWGEQWEEKDSLRDFHQEKEEYLPVDFVPKEWRFPTENYSRNSERGQ